MRGNMRKKRKFTASIWRQGKWFVAQCLEVDVASQGTSESAALKNLADALRLHFTPPVATRAPKVRPVEVAGRAANARVHEEPVRERLVHGERRCDHSGMGVNNLQRVENRLNPAVLAEAAVKRVEYDARRRLQGLQQRRKVRPDVKPKDVMARLLERIRNGRTRYQRDFSLGGPAAHENNDTYRCFHSDRSDITRLNDQPTAIGSSTFDPLTCLP